MPRSTLQVLLLICIVLSPAAAQDEGAAVQGPEFIEVARSDFTRELSRSGTFIPSVFDEIDIWTEEYFGELLLLEALPHGSPVNAGDVIARFDLRNIDRQILIAEREIRAAELQLESARIQAGIDAERESQTLESARKELELARRYFEGYESVELDLVHREAEARRQYTEHSIEDQQAELKQLEAMYRDDELTDATEEIVLSRSRRNLARTVQSLKLQDERRAYTEAFSEAIQTERRRKDVEAKADHLKRLEARVEIDGRTRRNGVVQVEEALADKVDKLEKLRRDREMLTVRAPRNGILLHGSADDYRPGKSAPRYERGQRAALRSVLFCVAEPDRVWLALDVPESELEEVREGTPVRVTPVAVPGAEFMGTLDLECYPSPGSARTPENTYAAVVKLESAASGIKPGMRGGAEIVTETLRDVIVLPRSAVFGAGSEAHCWVDDGTGEYKRVPVSLGPEKNGEVVVEGELAENQKVLLCAPAE
jgi:multidrug resistance efflux pump